jgi:uncharacterized protein (TIGR02284 family)
MNNEKTIDVLNSLITINNDRIEGYETASKETEEQDLKNVFGKLAQTSVHFNNALKPEVLKLGGEPEDGTRTTGKFFRVWMDVKAALTGNDRKAILNSCEYGEDVAKDTYQKVLEDDAEELTDEMKTLILAQHTLLVTDHNHIKTMIDAIV